jgi:N-formylglutamate deformylase
MNPLSCSPELIRTFRSAFENQGFSVALNFPYQGGYIVRHYGDLLRSSSRFAIQIEMNQDLYMAPGDLFPEARRIQPVYRQVLKALEEVSAKLGSIEQRL